jgi:hypothetical protein
MKKRKKEAKKSSNTVLPVMRPDAAGIDIGATEIFVAVPADRAAENVRSFPTFTQDLYATAEWLKQCCIKTVAMESTGVYWIPLFQILEARGFEVCLGPTFANWTPLSSRHLPQAWVWSTLIHR